MRFLARHSTIVVGALLLFRVAADAATPTTDKTKTPDPAALVDFAIPENPAAAILSSTIPTTKPTTPRDFTAGLNSLVDKDGRLQPGVSVAFAPYRLFRGQISYTDYQDQMLRFFSRAQVSVATKSVSATSTGVLAALGLNLVFIDDADPRQDSTVDEAFASFFPKAPTRPANPEDDAGVVVTPVDNVQSRAFYDYLQKYRKAKWNAQSFGAGFASRHRSASGSLNNAAHDGWAGWLTYANKVPGDGLLSNGLFLASVQYRQGEQVETNGITEKRDTVRGGMQIRYGGADFNGYVEVFYRSVSSDKQPKKTGWAGEAGLEYRVSDGSWLNLSWVDDATGSGDNGVRAGMRFGFGKGPKWALSK